MFYFWNILNKHNVHINKKTRTRQQLAKKLLKLIYKKNVFKFYHIMIIIIFLTFILSGLFFVRTTRIAEKKRAWKRGKTQGQRGKKTGKGKKKRRKKAWEKSQKCKW